jgi:glycosyltransferase involved in cell wall biosynthesis
MQQQLPLLTIITPSFNQGHFIEETIKSILSQNYPNLEHLVMDGGSKDHTHDVVKKYPNIIWTSEKDRGQTHAVNKGVSRAKGSIIGWVNSDDTFMPGTFDVVVKKFTEDPACGIVFGDYRAIDEKGATLYDVKSFCGSYEEMIRWWDYTYAVHQPTVFVKKEVFDRVGLLDESYHYAMDYEWWLRAAKYYPFQYIPQYLATYRMHKDAKSFAPLETYVYPEQLKASKLHWGPFWLPRYWKFRKSYLAWLARKPKETLHSTELESWFEEEKQKHQ